MVLMSNIQFRAAAFVQYADTGSEQKSDKLQKAINDKNRRSLVLFYCAPIPKFHIWFCIDSFLCIEIERKYSPLKDILSKVQTKGRYSNCKTQKLYNSGITLYQSNRVLYRVHKTIFIPSSHRILYSAVTVVCILCSRCMAIDPIAKSVQKK